MRWRVLILLSLLLVPSAVQAVSQDTSPETLIVTLDTWPLDSAAKASLAGLGVQVVDTVPMAQALIVQAPGQASQRLQALSFVAQAHPDEPIEPQLASSKPAAGLTAEIQEAGITGDGVNIAIVDSGIDTDHPALRDRIVTALQVGPDGITQGQGQASAHGTHVAGILVGTGAGSTNGQHAGIAPGAGLVSMDLSDQFTTSNALRAFEWIYENHETYDIEVIANSWGRHRDPATYEPDDALIRASDALVAEGLVVVFSAGNGGGQAGQMTLEATNPNVITVGATTDTGTVEDYSSRGPVYDGQGEADWTKPDLVAPGSRILSTQAEGTQGSYYVMMNGTSMAAPHVAGAAALLLSLRPDLSPQQVKGLLFESARDVGPTGIDHASGNGMLDIQGSLQLLDQAGDQVRERTSTTARDGELTGPRQASGVLSAASVDSEERFTFRVPANATGIQAELAWDGQDRLRVQIQDPEGNARTVMVTDTRDVEIEDPAPGMWEVELSPDGVARGTYEAKIVVTWLEHHEGVEIPVVKERIHAASFPNVASPGMLGPQIIPGVPNIVPLAAGGVLTLVMVAGKLTGRDPEVEEEDTSQRPGWTWEP